MRLLSPTERTGPVGRGTFVLGRFAGEPMFELPRAPLLIAPPPFEPTPAGGRGTDLCGVLAKPPLLRANPPLFAFAPTLPRLFPAKPPPSRPPAENPPRDAAVEPDIGGRGMFRAICVPPNPGRCATDPDGPVAPRPSIAALFMRGAPVDAPLTRPANGL